MKYFLKNGHLFDKFLMGRKVLCAMKENYDVEIISPSDIISASVFEVSDKVNDMPQKTKIRLFQMIDKAVCENEGLNFDQNIEVKGEKYRVSHQVEI